MKTRSLTATAVCLTLGLWTVPLAAQVNSAVRSDNAVAYGPR
jgi:hypothetical protein